MMFLLFLFMLSCTGGKTPDPKVQVRSYVDVMLEQNLSKEEVSYFPFYIKALYLCWTIYM